MDVQSSDALVGLAGAPVPDTPPRSEPRDGSLADTFAAIFAGIAAPGVPPPLHWEAAGEEPAMAEGLAAVEPLASGQAEDPVPSAEQTIARIAPPITHVPVAGLTVHRPPTAAADVPAAEDMTGAPRLAVLVGGGAPPADAEPARRPVPQHGDHGVPASVDHASALVWPQAGSSGARPTQVVQTSGPEPSELVARASPVPEAIVETALMPPAAFSVPADGREALVIDSPPPDGRPGAGSRAGGVDRGLVSGLAGEAEIDWPAVPAHQEARAPAASAAPFLPSDHAPTVSGGRHSPGASDGLSPMQRTDEAVRARREIAGTPSSIASAAEVIPAPGSVTIHGSAAGDQEHDPGPSDDAEPWRSEPPASNDRAVLRRADGPREAGHGPGQAAPRERTEPLDPAPAPSAMRIADEIGSPPSRLRLDVEAPALGSIRVDLRNRGADVSAVLVTEEVATGQALAAQATPLHRTLAEQGVRLLGFDVLPHWQGGHRGAAPHDLDRDPSVPGPRAPGSLTATPRVAALGRIDYLV